MNNLKTMGVTFFLAALTFYPVGKPNAQSLSTEQVKEEIKEYLGPCSGTSDCDIALSIAKDYLEKHEKRSKGLLSVKLEFYGDEDYTTLSFTSRGKLRVRYFDSSSMDFTTDRIDYDRDELAKIYETHLRQYGPVIFERWGYTADSGFERYKDAVRSFAGTTANRYMSQLSSSSQDAYEDF